MCLYFISDNSYFLSGIQACQHCQNKDISIISGSDVKPLFSPAPEALVIIYIRNLEMRRRILRIRAIANCRVIILTRMASQPVTSTHPGYILFKKFPWILPHNLSAEELMSFIDSAVNTPFFRKSTSVNDVRVFTYLAEGQPVCCLNEKLGLSEKYIYSLKRKTVMKYGLRGNSAQVTLACRDISGLSML